jgi:hypothetical protein
VHGFETGELERAELVEAGPRSAMAVLALGLGLGLALTLLDAVLSPRKSRIGGP